MRDSVRTRAVGPLVNYRRLAPQAVRAHPTDEHLLPLLVAFGASDKHDGFEIITTEVRYGMLSMESYIWRGA